MTDDIQHATAALRAGVSLLEGFGVTQGARIGMMREAIERLSMPMIEMQDDFLIKIETGETISWGEFKERQNVEAIGVGRDLDEAVTQLRFMAGNLSGRGSPDFEDFKILAHERALVADNIKTILAAPPSVQPVEGK